MSSKELLAEYMADLEELKRKTMDFIGSPYISKLTEKHRKHDQFFICKKMGSRRGNMYLAIVFVRNEGGKRNPQWVFSSFHIGMMNTFKGVSYIMFCVDAKQSIVFTPHFFRRYKERLMQVADWQTKNQLQSAKTLDEIASIYISRNPKTVWIETNSVYEDKTHLFSPIYDGVALLQWSKEKKLLQANTFITPDMLDKKQASLALMGLHYITMPEEEQRKIQAPDFIAGDESKDN